MNLLPLLAQNQMDYSSDPGAGGLLGGLLGVVFLLLFLAFTVVLIAAQWKVFTKAGKPGWASIIPIYNLIVYLEIVGRPLWWFVLCLIPGVNFVIGIMLAIDLAKSFGKDTGFAVGLILLPPIFLLMLAFGDARYHGPAAAQA